MAQTLEAPKAKMPAKALSQKTAQKAVSACMHNQMKKAAPNMLIPIPVRRSRVIEAPFRYHVSKNFPPVSSRQTAKMYGMDAAMPISFSDRPLAFMRYVGIQ